MARAHIKFTRRRFGLAVLAASLVLGPIPLLPPTHRLAPIPIAIVLMIPILVVGMPVIEIGAILAIGFVLGALLIPPVATNCSRNRRPAAKPAASISTPAPISK